MENIENSERGVEEIEEPEPSAEEIKLLIRNYESQFKFLHNLQTSIHLFDLGLVSEVLSNDEIDGIREILKSLSEIFNASVENREDRMNALIAAVQKLESRGPERKQFVSILFNKLGDMAPTKDYIALAKHRPGS